MAPLRRRPFWWYWELELSSHVERRMARRDFDELALRRMFEHAEHVRRECVRVVTAYPVWVE